MDLVNELPRVNAKRRGSPLILFPKLLRAQDSGGSTIGGKEGIRHHCTEWVQISGSSAPILGF
jgi:hypothetical protein